MFKDRGLLLSVGVHILFLIIVTAELYAARSRFSEQEQMIVVDLVTVAQVTNIRTTQEKAKLDLKNQNRAEQFYKERELERSSKQKEAPMPPQPPEAKKPEPLAVQPPPPSPDLQKKVEASPPPPARKEPVKKEVKPKPKTPKDPPKKPKAEAENFSKKIMDTLDKSTSKEKKYQTSITDVLGTLSHNYNDSSPLSISEVSYIKRKVSENWNTTYFSGVDDRTLGVDIILILEKGGIIKDVKIKGGYGKSSPHYQMFVDSAISAVKKASPLDQLNDANYDAWKEMELTFDPRGMVY